MMKFLILFVFLFSTCVKAKLQDPVPTLPIDLTQIKVKQGNYQKWAVALQEHNGFIEVHKCDSLLLSSLLAVSGGFFSPLAARDADDKWLRRPLEYGNCYPTESQSEISQDQILGLGWYLWRGNSSIEFRRDIAQRLLDYGQKHLWQMGEPRSDLTLFPFWSQATIAEMTYRLGGENNNALRNLLDETSGKLVWVKGLKGYRSHIQILHALLRSEMMGGADTDMIELFKHQAERWPENALFQYAAHHFTDGDMSSVVNILLREDLFPSNHLPTQRERNNRWLWEDEDWSPSDGDIQFSGGDFLFMASFL